MKEKAVYNNLHRLLNQTYKLLPRREEGQDWAKPLETITVEFLGMSDLDFIGDKESLISLICKLRGLLHISELELEENNEFLLYRRTIFECLSLIGNLKKCLEEIL